MERASEPTEGPDGSLRRACDQCRTRKIRCDKESPCSNCRIAQRGCSSTGAGQKPKEPRQRVLISTQYERKIDQFEARLAGIEEMLRGLTTSLSRGDAALPTAHSTTGNGGARGFNTTPPSAAGDTSASSTVGYDQTDVLDDGEDLDSAFEGNSSMAAQTVFASEFVEHAVTHTSLGRQLSPDIQAALSSLQQMVRMQGQGKAGWTEARFAHQKPMPKGGIRELPLPPTQVVVQILREIKDTPPMTFTLICAFIAVDDFIESCRKVYFATDDYSLAIFIIVNAGFYYLFQERLALEEAKAEEYLEYHYMCRDNLETALASLPLLMPPRMETIEALLLGATYSIETSKFTLAWQLNSAAAMMCQTLGWHRLPSLQEDEATDTKSAIFWFAYMLDKGLALRFGRSSLMQDYDITMPKALGKINVSDPWKVVLNLWISHAELMGKAYEQLYSPAALARPPEQRAESARLLVEALQVMVGQAGELGRAVKQHQLDHGHLGRAAAAAVSDPRQQPSRMGVRMGAAVAAACGDREEPNFSAMTLDMVLKADDVSYWASLTLIYRAIPNAPGLPSTFNRECIEAARQAFASHLECIELTTSSLFLTAGYLHWTILYAPFIPFIVLFCHVIETSDTEDLRRLVSFVATLQPVVSISEAIEKLHRVCSVLCNVATLYVEAKAKAQLEQDQDMTVVGNDLDMYLTQLGFMPQQQPPQQTQPGENIAAGAGTFDTEMPSAAAATTQSTQLGEWFSGNRHIMGLMEEDLSDFNPGVWSSIIGGP